MAWACACSCRARSSSWVAVLRSNITLAHRVTSPHRGDGAEFVPARKRDPVGLLLEPAKTRVPELVPVRHGRMLVSAFTFSRGAALPMAADLATTAASGLRVQLCGDAHLSNFGAFAAPERNLVFDVNDFDETLPGPFEWDVKRLAASLAVAGRDNGFPAKACRKITLAAGEGYRTAMRGFADQTFMDVWYTHVDIQSALAEFRSEMRAKSDKEAQKMLGKAHTSDTVKTVGKLTTVVDGQRRIISQPPLIVPVEEIFAGVQADAIDELIRTVLVKYQRTLPSERRHLLEHPLDGIDRVRQLKDRKFSIPIELVIPQGMTLYARLCGATLARAHARSGDRIALAAYPGGSDTFDQAIAGFAETYADQNERDYAALQTAVKEGRAEATTEI
jgi:Uncharacterized protein conserved in bacteria (DUF2252)